ncbi:MULTISPECIES: class I SAM-dependent methyltransferase [Streptomyces]|uniref:hypothetical protein n=1 Tax=Streptomyces TaxID=1883 RepID=UPI000A676061|nr:MULTISPECIES: hypothetical protein [Streptomyces]
MSTKRTPPRPRPGRVRGRSDSTEDFLQTTHTSYDSIAKGHAARFPTGPLRLLDRSVVTAFAELVTANGPAPVADLGCGPGHVTALLHDQVSRPSVSASPPPWRPWPARPTPNCHSTWAR